MYYDLVFLFLGYKFDISLKKESANFTYLGKTGILEACLQPYQTTIIDLNRISFFQVDDVQITMCK